MNILKSIDIHVTIADNGKLEVNELLNNMHILNAHSLNKEQLMHAFKMFDANGDGAIRQVA